MNIWLLVMINNSEPESKVYIVGAHQTEAAAVEHRKSLVESGGSVLCDIYSVNLDGPQPPILVGVAPGNIMSECKKNLPNEA